MTAAAPAPSPPCAACVPGPEAPPLAIVPGGTPFYLAVCSCGRPVLVPAAHRRALKAAEVAALRRLYPSGRAVVGEGHALWHVGEHEEGPPRPCW